MNDLERYFNDNSGRLIHKWQHYFEIYDKHFSRFRGKEVVVLEIGVSHGGSLQMWKQYFGDRARIFGVDVDPRCKSFEEERVSIFIGSQSDRQFLRDLKKTIPKVDVLIDDGGHTMRQQIVTFEELFDHVKDDGVYLCEDCHTSYWPEYGGGYRRRGSFIEYSKRWIDYLNAFHSRTPRLAANDFTRSVKSVHYYDSIVVVEKGNRTKPIDVKTGTPSWQGAKRTLSMRERLTERLKRACNTSFAWLNIPFYIR